MVAPQIGRAFPEGVPARKAANQERFDEASPRAEKGLAKQESEGPRLKGEPILSPRPFSLLRMVAPQIGRAFPEGVPARKAANQERFDEASPRAEKGLAKQESEGPRLKGEPILSPRPLIQQRNLVFCHIIELRVRCSRLNQ